MVYAIACCVILCLICFALKSHSSQHLGQHKIAEDNVGDAIVSTIKMDKPYIDEESISRYYSTISITVKADKIDKIVKWFIFKNDAIYYHRNLVRKFREDERKTKHAK